MSNGMELNTYFGFCLEELNMHYPVSRKHVYIYIKFSFLKKYYLIILSIYVKF